MEDGNGEHNTESYAVVKFVESPDDQNDEELISVVPSNWIVQNRYCTWPPKNIKDVRKIIIKKNAAGENWLLYPCIILKRFDNYNQALIYEKHKTDFDSSSTDDSRMHKRRRIRQRLDNDFVFSSSLPPRFESNPEHTHTQLADTISLDEEHDEFQTSHILKLTDISPGNDVYNNQTIQPTTYNENVCLEEDRSTPTSSHTTSSRTLQSGSNNSMDANSVILQESLKHLIESVNIIKAKLTKIESRLEENRLPVVDQIGGFFNLEISSRLPLNSSDELESFETLCNENDISRQQLSRLLEMIGGRDARKCIKNILSKLFTNALAAKCSWTGAKGNYKLQDLNLMNVCKSAVRKNFPGLKDEDFKDHLANWFRHANQRLSRDNGR